MMAFAEGEVAFFSAKHLDHRRRADVIESATPCRDGKGECESTVTV